MNPLHVIILAQGQQSRLPDLQIAKHLLPLGNGETILGRTLRMVSQMAPHATITPIAPVTTAKAISRRQRATTLSLDDRSVSLVSIDDHRPGAFQDPAWRGDRQIEVVTLAAPGNHAVAGLQGYLRGRDPIDEQIVVLLGDVIYSRAALAAVLSGIVTTPVKAFEGVTFVGSAHLGAGTGELFGIRVAAARRDVLMAEVPRTSAAFTSYQPGRLRELLWELQKRSRVSWELRVHRHAPFLPVSDYTTDIDTPADLARLPQVGELAQADDQSAPS